MSTPDGGRRPRVDGPADRPADTDPATPARPRWCVAAETVAVMLALASAAVVLASDDARWLRMAVVAALWSALIGATMLIRRAVAHDAAGRREVAALRRRYTRELEREVAARRDFEATLERDLRREVEREVADTHDEELATLRDELDRLRDEHRAVTARRQPAGHVHATPPPPRRPAASPAGVVPAPAAPPTAPTPAAGAARPADTPWSGPWSGPWSAPGSTPHADRLRGYSARR